MKSLSLSLNLTDLMKGFITTVIGAFLGAILSAIQGNTIAWTWTFFQPIVYAAIAAGISYLLKNLFTNSQDQFGKKEPK